jgi:eukaryotic-like serine/threonine-protein kinase
MRERVGSYRLVKRLGGGGMGEVFEAVHEQLERRAAIKFLHLPLCSHPQVAARFLNEARAVNIVRHPSLVDIFEIGQLDDGGLYIVMELLEGETLSQRLRTAGVLAWEEAVRLGRQIAAAVAAAHARGIVHRDLKPDNLMLIADPEIDGGARVKILDFGIAKMLGPSGNTPTGNLTRTGLILGTPQYMAPEQCRGSRDVDGKADVYALGVLLYQLLSGSPPFSAGNEWELLAMHLEQEPPPLPSRIKPALSSLIARMLEKEPGRRPTMAEVATRLGELRPTAMEAVARSERPTIPASRPLFAPRHTTLGGAAAEMVNAPKRGGARWLLAACSTLGCALAVGGFFHFRPPAPPIVIPAAPTPARVERVASPAPRPLVRWTLTSLPGGASIDSLDGEHLGETPWHQERPAAMGTMVVRFTLPGYRARELSLDLGRDQRHQIQLKRRADSTPTPSGDADDVQTVH